MKNIMILIVGALSIVSCGRTDGIQQYDTTVLDEAKGHSYCSVNYNSNSTDLYRVKVVKDDIVVSDVYTLSCASGVKLDIPTPTWDAYDHPTVQQFFAYAQCTHDLQISQEHWCSRISHNN